MKYDKLRLCILNIKQKKPKNRYIYKYYMIKLQTNKAKERKREKIIIILKINNDSYNTRIVTNNSKAIYNVFMD